MVYGIHHVLTMSLLFHLISSCVFQSLATYSCTEILQSIVPRLRDEGVTLYDILDCGLAGAYGERPSYTRMLQVLITCPHPSYSYMYLSKSLLKYCYTIQCFLHGCCPLIWRVRADVACASRLLHGCGMFASKS